MIAEVKHLVQEITHPQLRDVCNALWMDIRYDTFFTHPASLNHHHAYTAGLAAHTLEVSDYALNIAVSFPTKVNRDVLIAACLWHDMAKIHEYWQSSAFEWAKTDYATRIGHIAGSAGEFTATAREWRLDRTTEEAVVHCILSHHGPVREWGSPVAPESLEALILHQADMLSANYGATK